MRALPRARAGPPGATAAAHAASRAAERLSARSLRLLSSGAQHGAPIMAAAAVTPAAVQVVPASSLHVSEPTWWLTSRFHFSFVSGWGGRG
jgi:hypothetical protein